MAVITAAGLSKTFGSRRAVDALRFEVGKGEVFGFLGPNGAGKSTTIRLLMGLYRPTAGTVAVLGLDPVRDGAAVRRQVGYLPGELALHLRLTGGQHVRYVARARGLTRPRFPRPAGRPVRRDARPARCARLSKGNRQKIGIILAFMPRPELLILDEPTSGLDPLMQDEFERLVRETCRRRAHRVPVLARARRGSADRGPGGHHQGRPARRHRHCRWPARVARRERSSSASPGPPTPAASRPSRARA